MCSTSILGDRQTPGPLGKNGVLILWGRKAKSTEMVRTAHREGVREEQVGLSKPRAQHHGERLWSVPDARSEKHSELSLHLSQA